MAGLDPDQGARRGCIRPAPARGTILGSRRPDPRGCGDHPRRRRIRSAQSSQPLGDFMSCVLVTGASGFIGSHLCTALVEAGHDVRAMTRRPDDYTGAGTPAAGRRLGRRQPATGARGRPRRLLPGALPRRRRLRGQGRRGGPGLQRRRGRERRRAHRLPRRPRAAMIKTCRRTCGPAARSKAYWAPTACRSPSCGRRSSSATAASPGRSPGNWSSHLPAMVGPRWVTTKTQPIALPDVVRYLVGVLEPAGGQGAGLRDRWARRVDVRRDDAAGGAQNTTDGRCRS